MPAPLTPVRVASDVKRRIALHDCYRSCSNVDITSRFGLRLRELRLSRNMTQLQMAVSFGIDRSYLSDVERGRKAISLPTLEVIALGFELSLSQLLENI